MGDAIVIVKIYPEDIDSVSIVEQELKKLSVGTIRQIKREPVAFGMELIKAAIIIPDKTDGIMDKLEAAIKALKGVNEVEVEGITLI